MTLDYKLNHNTKHQNLFQCQLRHRYVLMKQLIHSELLGKSVCTISGLNSDFLKV